MARLQAGESTGAETTDARFLAGVTPGRGWLGTALLSAFLASFLLTFGAPAAVRAQGASSSGAADANQQSQPAARSARRASPRQPRQARPAAASASFDGAWAGVSIGPCISTWRWDINVNGGTITGNQVTGQVSRGGSVRGSMVVFRSTYIFVGRMSGRTANGTWSTTGNCSGSWTATRS